MEVLLIYDKEVSYKYNLEYFLKTFKNINITLIKDYLNEKEISRWLIDNGYNVKHCIFNDFDTENFIKNKSNRYDIVLYISNLGKDVNKLISIPNLYIMLDKGGSIGKYIDDPYLEEINLKEKNLLEIREEDCYTTIKNKLNKRTVSKLIKILYRKKIVTKNNSRYGDISLLSILLNKGIIMKIEDNISLSYDNIIEGKNIHPLQKYIISSNIKCPLITNEISLINGELPLMKNINLLKNTTYKMNEAIKLIDKHIKGNIVLVTDSDCDGLTSAALGYKYFKHYHNKEITVITNERRYGNGVNDTLTDEILSMDKVDLVITADHGMLDDERYKRLKENKIDIIVTDHHSIGKNGLPKYADVVLNPMDKDSCLPTDISGCTVLYTLFYNHYDRSNILHKLLPYVGISIISDVMPLDKPLNRDLFKWGILDININDYPFLKILEVDRLNSKILSYKLITYINAGNRMGNSRLGYELLISNNIHQAEHYLNKLIDINNKKKKIVNELIKTNDEVVNDNLVSKHVDCEYDGVMGIIASRLENIYNRCTLVMGEFDGKLKGSIRCNIDNVNISKLLKEIDKESDVLIGYGGHKGAGGVTIHLDKYEEFLNIIKKKLPINEDKTDNDKALQIPLKYLNENTYKIIEELEPYGMKFNLPVFLVKGRVINISYKYVKIITLKDEENITVDIKTYDDIDFKIGDNVELIVEISWLDNLEIWKK